MQLQDDAKDPLKIRRISKIKRRRSSVTHRRGDTVDLASTITGLSGSSLHRHTNSATTQGTSEDHAPASPIYNVDTLSFTIDGEEGEDEDDDDDNDVVEGVPLFEQFVVVGPEPAAAREAHMDKLIEFHSAAGLMKKFGRMLSKERDSDAADIRAIAQPKVPYSSRLLFPLVWKASPSLLVLPGFVPIPKHLDSVAGRDMRLLRACGGSGPADRRPRHLDAAARHHVRPRSHPAKPALFRVPAHGQRGNQQSEQAAPRIVSLLIVGPPGACRRAAVQLSSASARKLARTLVGCTAFVWCIRA